MCLCVCLCVCVFVCDLAKALLASIDACYTKKNQGKHTHI